MTIKSSDPKSVFINCPFDGGYLPLFHSMVFTIISCGFRPRCSLEVNNAAQIRIEKIADIIEDCQIGIHDISRTELDNVNKLPRFNMPLELGLYLGARYYGGKNQGRKSCLILDHEQYRYQMYISDIAGQDISAHNDSEEQLILAVRNYLNGHNGKIPLIAGENLWTEYQQFKTDLPAICKRLEILESSLQYADFLYIVSDYVSDTAAVQL